MINLVCGQEAINALDYICIFNYLLDVHQKAFLFVSSLAGIVSKDRV